MVRRGLRRLPPFKDYLFRAMVLLTLSIFVVGFALSRNPPANPPQSQSESAQSGEQQKSKETFWERLTDDPTAYFTAVLALFTFVLAGTSFFQIYFLFSADRSTRLAARAAINSANIAARTVRSIEDTAERQIRAYVGVERAYLTSLPITGFIGFVISIRNGGATPSFDQVANLVTSVAPVGISPDVVADADISQKSKASLMPGSSSEIKIDRFQLPPGIQTFAIAGNACVWITGEIIYKDVFGKMRSTKVRMMANPGSITFVFAEGGNHAT